MPTELPKTETETKMTLVPKGQAATQSPCYACKEELKVFREEFASLKTDIKELIELFNSSKAVVSFIRKTGNFLRWVVLTGASVTAIWVAIVKWRG